MAAGLRACQKQPYARSTFWDEVSIVIMKTEHRLPNQAFLHLSNDSVWHKHPRTCVRDCLIHVVAKVDHVIGWTGSAYKRPPLIRLYLVEVAERCMTTPSPTPTIERKMRRAFVNSPRLLEYDTYRHSRFLAAERCSSAMQQQLLHDLGSTQGHAPDAQRRSMSPESTRMGMPCL